jgi:hypothetical protein
LNRTRKLTAAVSIALLIVVAGLAFTLLQVDHEDPPPLLDPEFDLWVTDSDSGRDRPMVWKLEYVKGSGDEIVLQKTMAEGRSALDIRIFQDGVDDRWVYVYLGQTIDGARLRALFKNEIGLWVLTEGNCPCSSAAPSQSTVIGVETNDGTHTLTFIFSDQAVGAEEFLAHRTLFLKTPPGEWAYQRIDLAGEYENSGWDAPDRITFNLVLGVPGFDIGWHEAYVNAFTVKAKTSLSSGLQNEATVCDGVNLPTVSHDGSESQPIAPSLSLGYRQTTSVLGDAVIMV